MNNYYRNRQKEFAFMLQEENLAAAIFEDSENNRNSAIRYFTNHPGDAVLIITNSAETILCPWDENIAKKRAIATKIIGLTKYNRNSIKAIKEILSELNIKKDSRIDIPPTTPYPIFLKYVEALFSYNVLCRENGIHQKVDKMRAIKDYEEIKSIRKAAEITDELILKLEKGLKNDSIKTETDVALMIEKECRIAGCEGTGFESLVAGTKRSFGIHCFPSYTANSFGEEGLSLVDFGVIINGYTSDVTVTIAKGNLSEKQEKQLNLVQKAYDEALKLYKPFLPIKTAAEKVDSIFSKGKTSMPHALGHGIGLEAHEFPVIKSNISDDIVFKPGMIVTLEPGLYNTTTGGCRLENDILITEFGNEVLTHSQIIRL